MTSDWQQQLTNSIKSLDHLVEHADDKKIQNVFSEQANEQFKIKIPSDFLSPHDGKLSDPLLAQVLPHINETQISEGYSSDPVGDIDAMATPGLIHKYKNRALFIVTGACAIHCRYCFRRHFPYADSQINKENWEPAFEYLREHTEISEIILSGGDPLMINDEKLAVLMEQLEQIQHIKRLRIHSRIPSVLPARITNKLISLLQNSRFNVSIVTHINHADELNHTNKEAFERLKQSNIQMLNQSVLLANVNDHSKTLIELSEKLYENGILPYYLHLLDLVQGAAHFFVNENDARALINDLAIDLPGYLVPRLVKEISGKQAKTRIM